MRSSPMLSRLVLLAACALVAASAAPAQDLSLAARRADFHTFVDDFKNSYAYLDADPAHKPWLTWESRYASAVDQAETVEAFDAVLADALSELHDFHAEVRSPVVNRWLPVPTFADIWAEFRPAGAVVTAVRRGSDAARAGIHVGDTIVTVGTTSQPIELAVTQRLGATTQTADAAARNWALLSVLAGRADEARTFTLRTPAGRTYTVTLQVERHFDRSDDRSDDPSDDPSDDRSDDQPSDSHSNDLHTSRLLPGNIGVIRFHNSLGEQRTVAAFDAALAQLRHTRGLVLDLRDVPSGGDSSVALGILGRFIQRPLAYQRHRIANYGQPDVERNWVEFAAPRGPFCYTAPVVVLVDHWTGSMGEGMAIGLDAMQRAVVVGTPMAHLAGAVSDDKLPRTGADVAYATEQIYHVNGMPRQRWLPPVLVPETAANTADDPILKRGLAVLQQPKHTQSGRDLTLQPLR